MPSRWQFSILVFSLAREVPLKQIKISKNRKGKALFINRLPLEN